MGFANIQKTLRTPLTSGKAGRNTGMCGRASESEQIHRNHLAAFQLGILALSDASFDEAWRGAVSRRT